MNNLKRITIPNIVFMTFLLTFFGVSHAEKYQMSERTVREFKEFSELHAGMQEMQRIGNIIMAIAPFRSLLDGLDPTDAIEIQQESWGLLESASRGLSSHYKSQLRTFCELEALSQRKSYYDYKFWVNLSKQFR